MHYSSWTEFTSVLLSCESSHSCSLLIEPSWDYMMGYNIVDMTYYEYIHNVVSLITWLMENPFPFCQYNFFVPWDSTEAMLNVPCRKIWVLNILAGSIYTKPDNHQRSHGVLSNLVLFEFLNISLSPNIVSIHVSLIGPGKMLGYLCHYYFMLIK